MTLEGGPGARRGAGGGGRGGVKARQGAATNAASEIYPSASSPESGLVEVMCLTALYSACT